MPDQKVEIPPGVVAVTTWGSVRAETVQSIMDLVRMSTQKGFHNVTYQIVLSGLVDKARNEAAVQMLANPTLKYLLFVDADMQFAPDMLEKMLLTAYNITPWADVVGAYCQLRGTPYLPTTDFGSGTWEPQDPFCGPLEVIRTGSACLLIKRHIFEQLEFPYYGVRPAPRPIDVLLEVDNYARCKMDGKNQLRDHPAWTALEQCARQDAQAQRSNPAAQRPGGFFSMVGEDSGFCDRVRALGGRIVVNTDIVCNHIDTKVIRPEDHINAMKESEKLTRLSVGVLE